MKRVNLFTGHYGSGKTNLAVNYAKYYRALGKEVAIADLDIVNPYFRTKDSESELEALGIKVVSLPFAGTNVDLPSLPSDVYALVERHNETVIFDIGGDDRGAYALGRFTPYIVEEDNYDMFFVVNFRRPLTKTAAEALESMMEIESASGLHYTGIINNTNIGSETTEDVILSGMEKAQELQCLCKLPIVSTSAERSLAEKMKMPGMFPLDLQKRPF